MAPSPDIMVDVSTPQILEQSVHCMRSRMGAGVLIRQKYSFWDKFPAFRSYCGHQLVHWHVIISSTSHILTPFLEVHQCRTIHIPNNSQHEFPSGSLCLEFFVDRRQSVVPLHRLSVTLRFIMARKCTEISRSSNEKIRIYNFKNYLYFWT